MCRGFWIFRGQDIPPIMKEECFDLDLYTWTKINPSDEVISCWSLLMLPWLASVAIMDI